MTDTAIADPPLAHTPQPTEHTLRLWDGSEIFYRAWLPAQPTDKALLLFHRGHEHSGRYLDVVEALGFRDVAVFAWDARGHGRSEGDRGYAPSFAAMVKDVDSFVRHISNEHHIPLENMAVLAHSVGAVAATAWVHDYAPPIRALVLATPALRVKLYVPLAIPALRVLQKFRGRGRGRGRSFIKSYVKAKMLTHDAEQARKYDEDPLIARSIAVNVLLDLYDASTRLLADAGAITVPTLMLAAGKDWVVHRSAQEQLFAGLSSPIKEMHVFPGMYHDILHEAGRDEVLTKVRRFIDDAFAREPRPVSLLDAHKQGYTRAEYDRLRMALKPSFKRISFAVQRAFLASVGKLSDGVRQGWQTGFDSGQSLDYVYRNRASGVTPLGRMIDRQYLNAIGWVGIRQRRANIEAMLRGAIDELRLDARPIRIVDIAAGAGRYVLESVTALPPAARAMVSVLLRDHNPANIDAARELAKSMGLGNVHCQQGDAFDGASLAAISPAPTIGVVSGLYELFPDNERVLGSLRGLARAMNEGGYLVYTNQPWHPQVEMIARTLINRDHQPWIMRRRTQAEMDQLVAAAGFEKVAMEIDQWGIFTVSLARRRGG